MLQLISMKEKIRDWILNSALKIGHLKDSERVSLELILIYYLVLCALFFTILYSFLDNIIVATLYGMGFVSMLLMFIQKSTQYRQFKLIEDLTGWK